MAQTITAKGTIASKTSGTTLTIPDIAIAGGDAISVGIAWNNTESAAPTIKFSARDTYEVITKVSGDWTVANYQKIVWNSKTEDLVATFPSAATAKVMMASVLHQAGKYNLTDSNINATNTVSHTGTAAAIDHITTLHHAFHMTNGPSGDLIGSSSTGHTLGQRAGTTGDTDTSNVTIQETYKIISASTITAGSFTIDEVYQIKTLGTTDFTLIGAAENTVGIVFTATGAGSGTGDAYHMETTRSRLTGLTSRTHTGIMAFYRPKRTYTIDTVEQWHRSMNNMPDWVQVKVTADGGIGFWITVDPDQFDDWSDSAFTDYIAKIASIYEVNIIDSNLVYEADSTRDTRMSGLEGTLLVL